MTGLSGSATLLTSCCSSCYLDHNSWKSKIGSDLITIHIHSLVKKLTRMPYYVGIIFVKQREPNDINSRVIGGNVSVVIKVGHAV